jgi:hypothetical protein
MWLNELWRRWLGSPRARRQPHRRPAPRRRGRRPLLEQLETRLVPASYSAVNVAQLIADINAANTAGGSNTVTLTAPTSRPYVLTREINSSFGATGLPGIAAGDTLTIRGQGDTIERSATAPAFRLFNVDIGASLRLQNLTLQGGLAFLDIGGGAIYNEGTLVLDGVTVQDNTAQGNATSEADGGGILSFGSVTLEGGTTLLDNQALDSNGSAGGGLFVAAGSATLDDAILKNNIARGGNFHFGGGSAFGGGLYVGFGTVTLINVTLDGNFAQGGNGGSLGGAGLGGGLYVYGGTVTLTNVTLDGNTAQGGSGGLGGAGGAGNGGGLYVASRGATVTLTGCTVQANSALGGFADGGTGNQASGQGGGIFITTDGAAVMLDAATVAQVTGNTASDGSAFDNIVGPYTLI